MKIEENSLGIYILKDDVENFVTLDLQDMIETYNLIQVELKKRGILF